MSNPSSTSLHSSSQQTADELILTNARDGSVAQSIAKVRVDESPNGQKRLVTTVVVPRGATLFIHPLTSVTSEATRTSIQVGEGTHTESGDTLCYMDHSFSPTVRLLVKEGGLHIIALVDLYPGMPITFDYNLTEANMSCPFVDYSTGSTVSGWDNLSPGMREAYRKHFYVAPYLKD